MSHPSMLSALRQHVIIDLDSMDPSVALRYTSDKFTFCDMTSNQAIVYSEASKPERKNILTRACRGVKGPDTNLEQQVESALTVLTVLLAKEIYPSLTGRIHIQTSPTNAYDTKATIIDAKKLVDVFESIGIPRSRVCIKIPATPESVISCQYLQKIGISTLATCVFNLPQALAASQAGCVYVAPYFNELRVHFEQNIWKEYPDPAKEHPAGPIITSIIKAFKDSGSSTAVMPASIVTSVEAIALASLAPSHLTLSPNVLDQLATMPEQPIHPVSGASDPLQKDSVQSSITNYLEDGGQPLREALIADTEASRKLSDALAIFGDMEEKTKDLLRKELTK